MPALDTEATFCSKTETGEQREELPELHR
jgi:hypothetical protein